MSVQAVLRHFAIGLLMISLAGCGNQAPGESHITHHTPEQLLRDFADLYRCAQLGQNESQAPSRLQDLEKCKQGFVFGYDAASKGTIVVQWGARIGQGNAVLAYEKDASVRGGWVLFQDGTVKQLTRADFRAVPKALK